MKKETKINLQAVGVIVLCFIIGFITNYFIQTSIIKQEPIKQEPIKQEPIKQEPIEVKEETVFVPFKYEEDYQDLVSCWCNLFENKNCCKFKNKELTLKEALQFIIDSQGYKYVPEKSYTAPAKITK